MTSFTGDISTFVGGNVSLGVDAEVSDPSALLRIFASPVLPGSTVSLPAEANPVSATYSWTVPSSEADLYAVVVFLAVDEVGDVRCQSSATIRVETRFHLSLGRLMYDFENNESYFEVTVRNDDDTAFTAGDDLRLVVAGLYPTDLSVANATIDDSGLPAFELSSAFGADGTLTPSETSEPIEVRLANPDQARLGIWLRVPPPP